MAYTTLSEINDDVLWTVMSFFEAVELLHFGMVCCFLALPFAIVTALPPSTDVQTVLGQHMLAQAMVTACSKPSGKRLAPSSL